MDKQIDYSACEDAELIEIYGRLDPSRAPVLSEQVKELLVNRGFVLPEGDVRLGNEIHPSREKLQELIGAKTPLSTPVFFGEVPGILGWLQAARNDFNLVGHGNFEADGVYLRMIGARGRKPLWIRKARFQKGVKLDLRRIVDVEIRGNAIGFGYQVPGEPDAGIRMWFPNQQVAAQIAEVLPKTRTPQFRPQLGAEVEYQEQLLQQPPKSAATVTLLAANVLLFLGAALGGAGWLIPNPAIEIVAGSNLASLTTQGEWWRLITALFVHFGLIHLVLDMWALAAFGAIAERLLGVTTFLFIYFVAGITANLASIRWNPDVNSGGASGAILGVLGALLVLYWRNKRTLPFRIVRFERNAILAFVGIVLLAGVVFKGMNNAAHLAGLVTGLLLGLTLAKATRNPAGNIRNPIPALATLLVAAVVLTFGFVAVVRNLGAPYAQVTHKPQT